jgi:hypothetical protein
MSAEEAGEENSRRRPWEIEEARRWEQPAAPAVEGGWLYFCDGCMWTAPVLPPSLCVGDWKGRTVKQLGKG